jgi:hypothetical protein
MKAPSPVRAANVMRAAVVAMEADLACFEIKVLLTDTHRKRLRRACNDLRQLAAEFDLVDDPAKPHPRAAELGRPVVLPHRPSGFSADLVAFEHGSTELASKLGDLFDQSTKPPIRELLGRQLGDLVQFLNHQTAERLAVVRPASRKAR